MWISLFEKIRWYEVIWLYPLIFIVETCNVIEEKYWDFQIWFWSKYHMFWYEYHHRQWLFEHIKYCVYDNTEKEYHRFLASYHNKKWGEYNNGY